MCNKGPVSGWELRAIKTAATDLGETAGIHLRNPDYVATAEAEQKAPSSWKAKRWQLMSNQLHYPTVPASPTRVRASSRRIGGGGLLLLVLPPDSPTKGRVRTPVPSPHGATAAGQAKQSVLPKIRAALCQSKNVVFHSAPSLEAPTGLPAHVKRDEMPSNLVKISLAGLAPGSRSSGRPQRGSMCSLLSCG